MTPAMAMSLLRCQRCFHVSIWRSLGQQHSTTSKFQQVALQIRRDYSKYLIRNQGPRQQLLLVATSHCSPIQSRQFVLVGVRRIFRKGPWKFGFMFGFVCMALLMVLDASYDNYRRSGLSLSDFLSFRDWFSSEPTQKTALEKTDDAFDTKFAKVLSKEETPQLIPSRTVSVFLYLILYSNISFFI